MQPASLEDLRGDPDARVADFFALWNKDLPASQAAINNQICHKTLTVHGRAKRVRALILLFANNRPCYMRPPCNCYLRT